MAVEIVQTGAPVLRERAREVPREMFGTEELRNLVAIMVDTMRHAPGVGLAAPQIGIPLRLFVIEDRAEYHASATPQQLAERERVPVEVHTFINPKVTPVGEEKVTFVEGCLSVAGFGALVPRHREVEVSARDVDGNPFTWRVRGWPARILQHEMDHLEGALYIDRMYSRSFSTYAQLQARTEGKSAAEVLEMFGVER